jgi:FixJ family two-component response regulator
MDLTRSAPQPLDFKTISFRIAMVCVVVLLLALSSAVISKAVVAGAGLLALCLIAGVPDVVQAMEGGAISWVVKSRTTDELLSRVDFAAEKTLQMASLLRDRAEALGKWDTLNPAEKRSAPICARGLTAKTIAAMLSRQGTEEVSHRTVEGHTREILSKLSMASTNEPLAYMIRFRLPPENPLI